LKKPLPHPLLGTLSADTFMRRYWQKKPLLIRQAVAGIQPMLSRQQLFALAESEDAESRLVIQDSTSGHWRMRQGPFTRRSLPSLKQSHWSLLVQGVDLHNDSVAALRDQFRFIPDARLDDVMISYATDQGGVGRTLTATMCFCCKFMANVAGASANKKTSVCETTRL